MKTIFKIYNEVCLLLKRTQRNKIHRERKKEHKHKKQTRWEAKGERKRREGNKQTNTTKQQKFLKRKKEKVIEALFPKTLNGK